MANSLDQWIDSDALRRTAQDLLLPPTESEDLEGQTIYGENFVGFTGPQNSEEPSPPIPEEGRRALAQASETASKAGLIGLRQNRPTPPAAENSRPAPNPTAQTRLGQSPFRALSPPAHRASAASQNLAAAAANLDTSSSPALSTPGPDSPLLRRLKAFANWLQQFASADAIFWIDQDGSIFWDDTHNPKLLSVARSLGLARRPNHPDQPPSTTRVKISPDRHTEIITLQSRFGPMIIGTIARDPLSNAHLTEIKRAVTLVLSEGN